MSALIIIDPIGDIEIVLTQRNPPVSVLVSSKCLTLASKVFAVMLSPRFLEGASLAESGMAKIELEDDANTTTIILQALHHRNTKIPEALGVFELHSLALIVDKYELFEAILPWFRLWIAPYRSPDTAAASLCYEKWLLISWVSNESSIFTSISKKLLMESRVGEDGEMVTKEGQRFSEGLPDRIVDGLKNKRSDILDRLVGVILGETKRYETHNRAGSLIFACKVPLSVPQTAVPNNTRKICDAMNLGYLNHAFRRTKLWQNGLTENSAVTLDTPLKELMGIESMQAEDYPYTYSCVEPGGYCSSNISGNHSACGSKSKVLRIVKELEGLAVGLVLEEFRNLD